MKADKVNGNIAFYENSHTYKDLTDDKKKFISVTTLINQFAKPFDKEFWSSYKALERLLSTEDWKNLKPELLRTHIFNKKILSEYNIKLNDFNREQQNILDEWQESNREACDRGTKIHAQLEHQFYKMGANCTLDRFGIGGKFICDEGRTELDLDNGVYPEYLISRVSPDNILCLAGQIDLLIKNGDHFTIVDHKGLPLDTPILTSTGWSTMRDLKVGDKVFDKDGNLCNVIVKSAIHNNPCCKINFDNSESIVADIDHRWLVSFKLQKPTIKNPDGFNHKVMTTLELKAYIDSINKRTTQNTPKILNAKPLNTISSKLPLDPYLLGVWLGAGSKDCGVITLAANSPIWEELRARGYEIGENLNPEGVNMRTVYGIQKVLSYIDVLNNKHIPEIYLLASYADRLDLLRGLMDTNGYFHPKKKRFVITTSFDWQMEGMKQLISSLGCRVFMFREIHKYNGKEYSGWNINFTTDSFNPFLIKNSEINNTVLKDNNSFRNIESVEYVETVPTQCIAVDSPSHTYLCTHSLIVTHNTNAKIETKGFYNSSTKGTTKMKYPLSKLEDCNLVHYQLQLSTYAWMVQKKYPNAIIDDLIINHYDHENKNTLYHVDYIKKDVERMLAFYKKQRIHQIEEEKYKEIEY